MVTIRSAAKKLAKRGARKGGKARASVLTPEERTEIARQAANARWTKGKGGSRGVEEQTPEWTREVPNPPDEMPVSLFQGTLTIGDVSFPCHVLGDARRVIAQREVVRLLTGVAKGNLDRYLSSTALSQYLDT